MKNILFSFCYLAFAIPLIKTEWLSKTKRVVRLSEIITTLEDMSVTSCDLRCIMTVDCLYFGMERDINVGETADCFLLAGSTFKYMNKSGEHVKELYVMETVGACINLSPCKPNQYCIDTKFGFKCKCLNGSPEKDCSLIASSCESLKRSSPALKSGMYLINPSKPVSVYCDMETGTGGWMMIANVSIAQIMSATDAKKLTADTAISNDISELRNVANGRFRLNPVKLDDFTCKFTQIRFYCHKPGGHTIDIYTLYHTNKNISILDYFMLKTNERPVACGSFKRFYTDNSMLSRSCQSWVSGRWAGSSPQSYSPDRIYNYPFFVAGRYYFGLNGERMECDGYGGRRLGDWKIFVR